MENSKGNQKSKTDKTEQNKNDDEHFKKNILKNLVKMGFFVVFSLFVFQTVYKLMW